MFRRWMRRPWCSSQKGILATAAKKHQANYLRWGAGTDLGVMVQLRAAATIKLICVVTRSVLSDASLTTSSVLVAAACRAENVPAGMVGVVPSSGPSCAYQSL